MKWIKKPNGQFAVGEKYLYGFSNGQLAITQKAGELICIGFKVKDFKTAKQIAESIER